VTAADLERAALKGADNFGADDADRRERLRIASMAALLVALTLAAFWPVVHCGFVNFDDPQYVYDNPIVQRGLSGEGVRWAFTTGTLGNYHPLTWLSLMLDSSLWGGSALGFHLTNVVLHAANAVLLFLVLRRMTGAAWRSLLVAAIFAVHPLRVESVTWISARKDCLSALFGLLAIGAYVRYVARPTAARYAMVACLFAASLLCKATFVTLPAVLLLLDHWPLRRMRTWGELFMEKLPLMAVAIGAGAVTFLVQRGSGAVGGVNRYPLWMRVSNAFVAYLSYLGKTVLPTNLSVFYPHPRAIQLGLLIAALIVIVVISGIAFVRRRNAPWMLIGWLWFLGTLVPMIGLVQVGGQARADRYTYLPMIGLLIAVAWSLPMMRRTMAATSLLVVMTLGMMTHREIGHWRDSVTLWSRAIEATDENYVAHTNLAVELAHDGNLADAESHYRQALAIRPDWSSAHNGLGVLFAARGDVDSAIAAYESAIAARPTFAVAHRNLARQLALKGRSDEAVTHYRRALELRPSDATAHLLLGMELADRDDFAGAAEHLRTTLRYAPDNKAAQAALEKVMSRSASVAE
jgi:protein O-mannosyl-transferase